PVGAPATPPKSSAPRASQNSPIAFVAPLPAARAHPRRRSSDAPAAVGAVRAFSDRCAPRSAKARCPLLEECRHGLAVLGGLPAFEEHVRLAALDEAEVGVAAVAAEELLDHAELWGRVGGDVVRERERLGKEIVGRGEAVGEAPGVGVGAVVEAAGE